MYFNYLKRYSYKTFQIQKPQSGLLKYIVVIPAYCEPAIYNTLVSLTNCHLCKNAIEVIIITNYSERDEAAVKTENNTNHHQLEKWCLLHSSDKISFHPFIVEDLTAKHAGAGFARKIGMDTAIQRFHEADISDGVIISLDADTLVHQDYFLAIEKAFDTTSNPGGVILNFTHLTSKGELSRQEKAVQLYELHLRYYRHMLKWAGYPYSHYTIGSCFAVKANVYCKYGGMNRKKAGEDFYFLQKIFPNETIGFVKEQLVFPSARISNRVPFGTGPVLRKILDEGEYLSYSPKCFSQLKQLVTAIKNTSLNTPQEDILSSINPTDEMKRFLISIDFQKNLQEIMKNVATQESFQKRFFNWFDGLMVIKCFNYLTRYCCPKIEIEKAVPELIRLQGGACELSVEAFLTYLIELDKKK